MHPDFLKCLKAFHEIGITPNYTTNGMFVDGEALFTDILIDHTAKYCGGVAISCHEHLDEYWETAAKLFYGRDVKLNFHIIISDKASSDRFRRIFDEYEDMVDYFVLLPYGETGRAPKKDIDWDYMVSVMPENTKKIAFGANFHKNLVAEKGIFDVSLYEPEALSKFLDLKGTGAIYPSSFHGNYIRKDIF